MCDVVHSVLLDRAEAYTMAIIARGTDADKTLDMLTALDDLDRELSGYDEPERDISSEERLIRESLGVQ